MPNCVKWERVLPFISNRLEEQKDLPEGEDHDRILRSVCFLHTFTLN